MLSEDPDRTLVRAPAAPDDDDDRTVVKPATVPKAPVAAAAPRQPLPRPRHSAALPAGHRLHEYRIDKVLGQGGFGITYLATDVHLNAPVAIKEYLPEDIAFRTSGKTVSPSGTRHRERYRSGLESFLVEARTLASFRHPNIVRVARFFEANATAYMVLEYERGSPLKQWWPRHKGLPEKELMLLLQPLLDGLSVVHAAGFLHRDIKPDNIQVRRDDGSLVLLDFGSARQAATAGGQADVAVTPGYAPIEQYLDDVQGPWTDIYALGATLYWLVSGQTPPGAEERASGAQALVPAAERGRGRFSEASLAAIDWALQMEPAARPQDIGQWRSALFAAHAASLGLQEALRAQEESSRQRAQQLWHRGRAALRPSGWPLALKTTLVMVLTALLPMTITGLYNLNGSLAALSGSELRNLEELARSTAGRLSQLIVDSRHLARMLGSDADFQAYLANPSDAARETLRAKLAALVQADPDIHLVMVMDTAGTALVSNDPEVMGRNFGFREYFRSAMQGRPYTSGIVVGSVAGAAGMFYSEPVRDATGQLVGAVVLRIRASSFASLLGEASSGNARTPFVVDGDGVVILHPDAKVLYSSLAPLPAGTLAALRADQRFRCDTVASLGMPDLAKAMVRAPALGHVDYRSTLTRRTEVAGFAPVPGHDWVVGITESREQFEQPLRRLFLHLLVSAGLVGLLFLGLALRFARGIVRPIKALTHGADALKRGDYAGAAVTVEGGDEIGRLARTFNVMIDVLRQRETRGRGAAEGP